MHLDEPPVHPERSNACWQHEDRGRLFFQFPGDDVRHGHAHGLVVREYTRPHSSETTFLALGIWGAAMLNSVTPSSTSLGIISGSPAASPHTPTGMPAALAASQVCRIRTRTAGWSAFWSRRSHSLPLSAARVYWTRSFVPIEKKADSSASFAAQTAAAGVSIITPVSTSPISTPSDSSSLRHSRSLAFAASNSPTSATIGNITFRLPLAAARRMARSCGSKSSGVSRLILIPRQPRKGFSSAAWSTPGRSLSPPTSSVRTMTGFSPNARATALYASYCSSSEGSSSRSMNRNSVRKSPTPSAPHPRASLASDAEPRFAATSMRSPSLVRASTYLYSSRDARCSASAADILSNVATVSSSGSVMAMPSLPSMATLFASRASSRASPTPTTAGIPIERAMIETCEVLDPSAVTNPRANPARRRAVSEGARLRASTTEGVCIAAKPELLRPMSSAEIWPVTSRTSSALAAMYSSISANCAAYSSPTASTAASGLWRFLTRSSTEQASSGSSAISTWKSKMPASSSCPELRRPSPVCARLAATASVAFLNLASSASTSPSVMRSRSGSGLLVAGTNEGPTATPSEAPMPVSFKGVCPSLVFVCRDELCQGFYRLIGVLAFGADGDLLALSGESRYLQDALGVYFPITFQDDDLRGEPLGRLD